MADFDIDILLKPISEDSPSGKDLRLESNAASFYYQVKDARFLARDIERNNHMLNEYSDPSLHWRKIYELSIEILSFHSKDIEIACFLAVSANS